MSDFLGRIAARAVGEASLAQPRLPALFEQPTGTEALGLGIVDEEVVAPARARQVQRPARSQPAREARAREAPGPLAPPEVVRGREQPAAASVAAVPAPQVAEPSTPSDTLSLGGSEALAPLPPPAAATEQPVPTPPVVVPATPSTIDARVPEPAAPAAPAVGRDEPPAVRVHIGRLEVRANLQQTPPEPRPREGARPHELSLADYLRGKRETG